MRSLSPLHDLSPVVEFSFSPPAWNIGCLLCYGFSLLIWWYVTVVINLTKSFCHSTIVKFILPLNFFLSIYKLWSFTKKFIHNFISLLLILQERVVFPDSGEPVLALECLTSENSMVLEGIFQLQAEKQWPLNSSLSHLCLKELPELRLILKCPKDILILQKLKSLVLVGCKNLETIFSPTIFGSLAELSELVVSKCEKLENIVCSDHSDRSIIVSKLSRRRIFNHRSMQLARFHYHWFGVCRRIFYHKFMHHYYWCNLQGSIITNKVGHTFSITNLLPGSIIDIICLFVFTLEHKWKVDQHLWI